MDTSRYCRDLGSAVSLIEANDVPCWPRRVFNMATFAGSTESENMKEPAHARVTVLVQ